MSGSSSGPHGLPTNAKWAIGVSLPVAFIIVLFSILLFFRHRKQHGNTKKPKSRLEWSKPELEDTAKEQPAWIGGAREELSTELDGAQGATELRSASTVVQPLELDGEAWRPAELSATSPPVR